MIIRGVKSTDAEKLAYLIKEVGNSAKYMLWEADERRIQADNQLEMIESMQASENSTILVAEMDEDLVGYLFAMGGKARRNKHSVYIVIGILQGKREQGIGTKLFKKLDHWAKQHHIHRLELTVATKNEAGLSLYKKAGFEIEGTKRHSLLIDDEFVDEYNMAKLL
ncbi:GNAT family N-acetyltransferase [Oceanobacillus alkalisoli]|uniref:GNAT family N-acetyltransferase n=1 Tax=Oceanobacillus alkalisoli TaxID=2925113 RepID=UPI001F121A55|nr:GNAT family N-acetyltransferase [Oceanobacillus alkalisoli]MCF3943716.1 GNAT family N-acetyltransferase [Oceanobacillus alkalisoli]